MHEGNGWLFLFGSCKMNYLFCSQEPTARRRLEDGAPMAGFWQWQNGTLDSGDAGVRSPQSVRESFNFYDYPTD